MSLRGTRSLAVSLIASKTKLCKYLVERFDIDDYDKILDFGCGRGEFSKCFKRLWMNVTSYDVNDDLGEETYDIIFMKSVIEHLGHGVDEISLLRRRHTRQDGRIIIMTPDYNAQWKTFYDDPTHVHPYTVKGLGE